MDRQPKPDNVTKVRTSRRGKVGAPEVLTEELARRIARMIQDFPDANIEVNWHNVIEQTKRRFGKEFRRNVLAQKDWGGRRLIHESFQEAKSIQRRILRDRAPKYAKEPRSRLRMIVAKLQAENLALRETLARVRAEQYDELLSLLETRTPLHRAVEQRAEANSAAETVGVQAVALKPTRSFGDARSKGAKRIEADRDAEELEDE